MSSFCWYQVQISLSSKHVCFAVIFFFLCPFYLQDLCSHLTCWLLFLPILFFFLFHWVFNFLSLSNGFDFFFYLGLFLIRLNVNLVVFISYADHHLHAVSCNFISNLTIPTQFTQRLSSFTPLMSEIWQCFCYLFQKLHKKKFLFYSFTS